MMGTYDRCELRVIMNASKTMDELHRLATVVIEYELIGCDTVREWFWKRIQEKGLSVYLKGLNNRNKG